MIGIRNITLVAVVAALSLAGCANPGVLYPRPDCSWLSQAGCASDYMASLPEPKTVTAPNSAKATIIFMRSSSDLYAAQSSVFDITTEPPTLVGIVSLHKKIAYVADPGARRFMVIGESADFMDANLIGGKVYYVRVIPRWRSFSWDVKASFSLDPVAKSVAAADLTSDLDKCGWVENTPSSYEWAQNHMSSIQAKEAKYLAEWEPRTDKPTLNSEDAR